MEKEVFDKAMKGNEEEDFYKEYLKQREIGFEVYQTEVKEEIKKISSSEELHLLIAEYNFDFGNFLLEQIINHRLCDIETAKTIYWLLSPTYIYEKYDTMYRGTFGRTTVRSLSSPRNDAAARQSRH